MALVFDNKNIRVDFLSKYFDNSSDKYNTKVILFPVLRYKVLAPVIEDLNLNIFQKNILSVLNKGNFDIHKVSAWLNLDTQLIQMVVAELEQRGFTSNGKITQSGRELIEGRFSWFDNAEDIRKDIYYIYQDIYTKKLYPVLVKFDPTSDYFEYTNKKIQKESKGKNINIPASLIEPRDINFDKIQQPEVDEVFAMINEKNEIAKKHRSTPPSLIQFLDSEPTVSYLATTVYVDKNNSEIDNIKVMDPFHREDIAYWLTDSLRKASSYNKKLKDIFEKLVLDAKEEKFETFSDALKDIAKEAKTVVDTTFDPSLRKYKNLYKALEEFYMDLKLYEADPKDKYLKEAFKNSQTVLETLFAIIYVENKKGYDFLLEDDVILKNISLEEIKNKVLQMSPGSKLPMGWYLSPDAIVGMVNGVLKNKAQSLRARYIASILASVYDRGNPMYKLMNQKSDLLIYLEKVVKGRNAVGHKYKKISDDEIDDYYNEVIEVKIGIEEIILIFLEGK